MNGRKPNISSASLAFPGMADRKSDGFTLIEIALAIILAGLVLGAFIVGRDLVRTVRVRGAIAEMDKIKVAVDTFKTKYNCLPGDCGNITNFFPQDASCPSPVGNDEAVATCNGDGNGIIEANESLFFFQHLYLAAMISRKFGLPKVPDYRHFATTAQGNKNSYISSYYYKANGNINVSSRTAGYAVYGGGMLAPEGDAAFMDGSVPASFLRGGAYLLGGDSGGTFNYIPSVPTFDAFAMDAKIDDGQPGTGNIQVFMDTAHYWADNALPDCYTSHNPMTARYNLAESGDICALWIRAGF